MRDEGRLTDQGYSRQLNSAASSQTIQQQQRLSKFAQAESHRYNLIPNLKLFQKNSKFKQSSDRSFGTLGTEEKRRFSQKENVYIFSGRNRIKGESN